MSDWGFSDVVVWNRVLPYAEMKKVSDAMLKSVCGDSHYWNNITNVCTACPLGSNSTGSGCSCKELGYYWNPITNVYTSCPVGSNSTGSSCLCNQAGYFFSYGTNACTACPVGSNSTGNSCLCNQSGFYLNPVTNICNACPIGSNSTGSSCTCVGNTYFSSQSSTCDPYFSDGVIGDAPWGIWRAQSYDTGSPLVLKESRGNGQDIAISGSITINNSSGNGALNPVYSLQGGTTSTMLWPTELTGDFTICSMTRYTGSSNRQRILTTSAGSYDWFHGHHDNRRGLAYYSAWRTQHTSRGTLTDWLVMCGQNSASNSTPAPNNIIANGIVNFSYKSF